MRLKNKKENSKFNAGELKVMKVLCLGNEVGGAESLNQMFAMGGI